MPGCQNLLSSNQHRAAPLSHLLDAPSHSSHGSTDMFKRLEVAKNCKWTMRMVLLQPCPQDDLSFLPSSNTLPFHQESNLHQNSYDWPPGLSRSPSPSWCVDHTACSGFRVWRVLEAWCLYKKWFLEINDYGSKWAFGVFVHYFSRRGIKVEGQFPDHSIKTESLGSFNILQPACLALSHSVAFRDVTWHRVI